MRCDEPIALGLVGDVGEFDADGAAVGGSELVDEVAEGSVEWPAEIALGDALVHVGGRQAELGEIEQGMGRAIVAEGIEVGDEMAELAVGVDEVFGFDAGFGLAGIELAGVGLAGGVECAGEAGGASAGGFEAGEECLPIRVYRSGVGLVLLIEPVDVVGIVTIDDVEGFHNGSNSRLPEELKPLIIGSSRIGTLALSLTRRRSDSNPRLQHIWSG